MSQTNDNTPGLRGWLNRNPIVSTVVGIVMLGTAATVLALTLKAPSYEPMGIYYYDLNMGKLFIAPTNQVTPIAAPSQTGESDPTKFVGVLAHTFACGECGNESQYSVGWVETYNQDRVAKLRNQTDHEGNPLTDMAIIDRLREMPDGTLVRDLNGSDRWVPRASREASAIMKKARELCGGEPAVECQP